MITKDHWEGTGMLARPHLTVYLFVIASSIAICTAQDEVPQFKVWGSKGPEFAPVPDGWAQVPGEPRKRELPKLTDKDQAQGFLVFQRRPEEEVFEDTVPAWHEVGAKLQTFAAQGQYVPLTFSVHALEDLKDCAVTLGDWKGPDGELFPKSHVDVRVMRSIRSKANYTGNDKKYRLAPFLLEKHDHFDFTKGKSGQVWLTVNVPETAKPGDYTGSVIIQAEGKTSAEIPVLLRVLPFRLPPLPIEAVMSYYGPADLAAREKDLIDQREHGINNNEGGIGATIASRDRNFGDDDVEATKKSIHETLALRKKVYGDRVNQWPVTAEIGHEVLYNWNHQTNWFVYWPHSEKVESDFYKAIRTVEEAVKAEGGPPIRVFVMDEPGGHPDNFKETIYYTKLVKEKFPHLKTWCTLGGGTAIGIDELGLLGTYLDELSINRFNAGICKTLVDRKKPYGVYNGGSSCEAVQSFARDRYFFGMYVWKSGAQEVLEWVYAFGDPWSKNEAIRGNNGYVYRASDGPLPSIPWECIRTGLDDYRYTDLLWRLITAAKKSGDAKAEEAAKAGEATAREILGSSDFTYQALEHGTPPPSPATLDKWHWRTAAACVELLKFVPLEKALATTAERPGPFDLPAAKEEAALKMGPELIPDGGFENGAGVWSPSGKGSGGIDSAEHHSGNNSFKIENKKDATGMDVEVCVWGWGGPGPQMTLSAGKTYEFSAWLKCASGKPSLRFELSQQGRDAVSGETIPDASGWKRVFHRVTITQDQKPKYFAIWLQGPGLVWCDDLSLREVELPPIAVESDRTVLDSSDRLVPVSVKQTGGQAECSVHVRVPGEETERVLKVPAGGKAEVDFAGDKLSIGKHELVAKLDGDSFTRTVTFERIKGPFEK
jgi:hypothetical protein